MPSLHYGTARVQDEGDLIVGVRAVDEVVELAANLKERRLEIQGNAAPVISSSTWLSTSDALSLDTLKGKVILLQFWKHGCIACEDSLSFGQSLHQKLHSRGLAVIGLATARDSRALDELLKTHHVTFPMAVDQGQNAEHYAVTACPTFFLIDKEGRTAWGFSHAPPAEYLIENLLR